MNGNCREFVNNKMAVADVNPLKNSYFQHRTFYRSFNLTDLFLAPFRRIPNRHILPNIDLPIDQTFLLN